MSTMKAGRTEALCTWNQPIFARSGRGNAEIPFNRCRIACRDAIFELLRIHLPVNAIAVQGGKLDPLPSIAVKILGIDPLLKRSLAPGPLASQHRIPRCITTTSFDNHVLSK